MLLSECEIQLSFPTKRDEGSLEEMADSSSGAGNVSVESETCQVAKKLSKST